MRAIMPALQRAKATAHPQHRPLVSLGEPAQAASGSAQSYKTMPAEQIAREIVRMAEE